MATVCYTTIATYKTIYYFCYNEFYQEPGITFLGFFGCFLFLFSANFGQFDSFIDDHTEKFSKYRITALLMPSLLFVLAVLFCFIAKDKMSKTYLIFTLVGFAPAIFASYYNFKHLIFPDMGLSFLKGVRLCNLFALLIEVFELGRLFVSLTV